MKKLSCYIVTLSRCHLESLSDQTLTTVEKCGIGEILDLERWSKTTPPFQTTHPCKEGDNRKAFQPFLDHLLNYLNKKKNHYNFLKSGFRTRIGRYHIAWIHFGILQNRTEVFQESLYFKFIKNLLKHKHVKKKQEEIPLNKKYNRHLCFSSIKRAAQSMMQPDWLYLILWCTESSSIIVHFCLIVLSTTSLLTSNVILLIPINLYTHNKSNFIQHFNENMIASRLFIYTFLDQDSGPSLDLLLRGIYMEHLLKSNKIMS